MTRNLPPDNFGPYFIDAPDQPFNYHLFVQILPLELIDRLTLAARHHAARVRPNPHDNRGDNMNYPVRDKERVNLIRHCLINRTRHDNSPRDYPWGYDNLLFRINAGGQNVAERQLDLKLAILRLIGANYPELTQECDYQRWQLMTRSNHEISPPTGNQNPVAEIDQNVLHATGKTDFLLSQTV